MDLYGWMVQSMDFAYRNHEKGPFTQIFAFLKRRESQQRMTSQKQFYTRFDRGSMTKRITLCATQNFNCQER